MSLLPDDLKNGGQKKLNQGIVCPVCALLPQVEPGRSDLFCGVHDNSGMMRLSRSCLESHLPV